MTELIPYEAQSLSPYQQLDEQARSYIQDAKSPSTRKAYDSDMRDFAAWCRAHHEQALPALPITVVRYITDQAASMKATTIERRLAAIAAAHHYASHVSPTEEPIVRETMRGIRRAKAREQTTQKEAAVTDILREMIEHLPTTTSGIHDRALLLVGFAGAFRRSELVSLDMADIQFPREGLVVKVRVSKTDQEGAGMEKGIPYGSNPDTCPVRALQDWLEHGKIMTGALFHPIDRHGNIKPQRLSPQGVARIVKEAALRAGLDPAVFAGHSLRAGFATAAAMGGADERSIMDQTGHKSVMVARRYIRRGSLFRNNAATKVGL